MARPQGIEPCQSDLESNSPALEHGCVQVVGREGIEPSESNDGGFTGLLGSQTAPVP